MKILRAPLLHFLLIGALLFALRSFEREPIRISAAEVQVLRAGWQRDTGRPPSAAELDRVIEKHIGEETLLREALRLGLERSDPVARQRILANMRFAFPDSVQVEDALVRDAQALGMPQRDLVLRRRLVQVMENRLARGIAADEAALAGYAQQHEDRYGELARTAFQHRLFGAHAESQDALAKVRAGGVVPVGRPFLLGEEFAAASDDEVARTFGPEFAEGLRSVPVGEWVGPLPSAYGWHLVRVESRKPAAPPRLADVRSGVAYAWLHEQEDRVVAKRTAALRARYSVEFTP